jgi:hypothetical protein
VGTHSSKPVLTGCSTPQLTHSHLFVFTESSHNLIVFSKVPVIFLDTFKMQHWIRYVIVSIQSEILSQWNCPCALSLIALVWIISHVRNAVYATKCLHFHSVHLRFLCGAGGYPPNVLQPTKAYCTNPTLVSSLHLQRRSTSDDARGLY